MWETIPVAYHNNFNILDKKYLTLLFPYLIPTLLNLAVCIHISYLQCSTYIYIHMHSPPHTSTLCHGRLSCHVLSLPPYSLWVLLLPVLLFPRHGEPFQQIRLRGGFSDWFSQLDRDPLYQTVRADWGVSLLHLVAVTLVPLPEGDLARHWWDAVSNSLVCFLAWLVYSSKCMYIQAPYKHEPRVCVITHFYRYAPLQHNNVLTHSS